MQPALVSNFPA